MEATVGFGGMTTTAFAAARQKKNARCFHRAFEFAV
ncbi:MAG: hypothetical protein JWQ51_2017 [Tardiphaga sp.]|nr:hypothetical protein [Tardiphaga sp.]